MKLLMVLTFDVPEPEAAGPIVRAIVSSGLPYFSEELRAVMDPEATALTDWLDE